MIVCMYTEEKVSVSNQLLKNNKIIKYKIYDMVVFAFSRMRIVICLCMCVCEIHDVIDGGIGIFKW